MIIFPSRPDMIRKNPALRLRVELGRGVSPPVMILSV